jgi:1,2-diacylglycerol 3-beta-glucosyltransferase
MNAAIAVPTAMILFGLCYTLLMAVLSVGRRPPEPGGEAPFFVFLLACLDEEKVIENGLNRLLAPPGEFAVMVVDDASSDRTAEIVRAAAAVDDRVLLFQRTAPNAQLGKGAALNAGLDHLRGLPLLADRDPADVVICVLDADGRLEPGSCAQVAPYFVDPTIGAVQICVRMVNRRTGLLPRMQDMEFVVYTDLYQRGRQRLGSVGLGGNGQFMRLSALNMVGVAPWSDSLTEDLDLGLRLLATGNQIGFCPTAAVHQQALSSYRRLIRQRSRWFQGHLQAGWLLPMVSRRTKPKAAPDLIYHLMSPWLLLVASLLPVAFFVSLVAMAMQPGRSEFTIVGLIVWYLLSFGTAILFARIYRRREPEVGYAHSILLGHLFILYGYHWLIAGWFALVRFMSGRRTWLKTARI